MVLTGSVLLVAAAWSGIGVDESRAGTAARGAPAPQAIGTVVMTEQPPGSSEPVRAGGARVKLPDCGKDGDRRTRIAKAQPDPPLDQLKQGRCPGLRTKIGVAPNGPTKF